MCYAQVRGLSSALSTSGAYCVREDAVQSDALPREEHHKDSSRMWWWLAWSGLS